MSSHVGLVELRRGRTVPGRVSGAFVFKGTRLPVATLFENLEAARQLAIFLKWYEGVTHEQVVQVLKYAERSLAPGLMRIPFDQGRPLPTERGVTIGVSQQV